MLNLRFSESEIEPLMELIALATLIAEWNQQPHFKTKTADMQMVGQKILEHLYHAGYTNLVAYDSTEQLYHAADVSESKSCAASCFDEFRQESFWEELVIRLADRELIQRIGFDAWNRLSEETRREKTVGIEKRYWREFEAHGIDHLHLIYPQGMG
jgi:F0F1-type ATP synthase gamma subunit